MKLVRLNTFPELSDLPLIFVGRFKIIASPEFIDRIHESFISAPEGYFGESKFAFEYDYKAWRFNGPHVGNLEPVHMMDKNLRIRPEYETAVFEAMNVWSEKQGETIVVYRRFFVS